MQVNTAPTTNKVNPTEMRFLREATANTATGCKRAARQSIVSYMWLSQQMDLRQEAAALDAEDTLLASRPALSYSATA